MIANIDISNYTTYYSDNNKKSNVDEEEDNILREKFKDLMKEDNITLDTVKNAFSLYFPPLTAPGSVRRASRLAEEKMSTEQKKAFDSLGECIEPHYVSRVMKPGQDRRNFNINDLLNDNDLSRYMGAHFSRNLRQFSDNKN